MGSKGPAKLVLFGLGGFVVNYAKEDNCRTSLSGYDRPDQFDYSQLPDGCIVIDKREAVKTPEGYSWVFRGPLVDVDLPIGQIDRCPNVVDSHMCNAMMREPGNGYGFMLAIQAVSQLKVPESVGALDSVDLHTYAAGWKQHGARVGIVESGNVVWSQ